MKYELKSQKHLGPRLRDIFDNEVAEAADRLEGLTQDQQERFKKLMAGERGDHVPKDFKVTVQEAALMAKDESVYKQFTHKAPSRTSVKI